MYKINCDQVYVALCGNTFQEFNRVVYSAC